MRVGAVEVTLGNGMRVCYQCTDFLDDQVRRWVASLGCPTGLSQWVVTQVQFLGASALYPLCAAPLSTFLCCCRYDPSTDIRSLRRPFRSSREGLPHMRAGEQSLPLLSCSCAVTFLCCCVSVCL